MMIRDATLTDWSAIWPFLREIVAAGETYTWPRDVTEERARDMWLVRPPSRTVVAVDQDGTVLGPAKMNPNQPGPGSHIASASFIVAPPYAGRGIGRALGEQALRWARVEGYRGMRSTRWSRRTPRQSGCGVARFRDPGALPKGFRHPTHGVGLHIMHRRL